MTLEVQNVMIPQKTDFSKLFEILDVLSPDFGGASNLISWSSLYYFFVSTFYS